MSDNFENNDFVEAEVVEADEDRCPVAVYIAVDHITDIHEDDDHGGCWIETINNQNGLWSPKSPSRFRDTCQFNMSNGYGVVAVVNDPEEYFNYGIDEDKGQMMINQIG